MIRASFRYTAIAPSGERREGTLHATDEQDAFRKVSSQGLTPIRIRTVRSQAPIFSFQQIKAADIADFTRELSVLVEAKIPLARGLLSIAEHEEKPALRHMIRDIATIIEAGSPMTEALEKYRTVFGEVYIETIHAAEKSGNLAEVASHLAELLERQLETRQQLRRALTYPLIVMVVVAVALTVIVVFVVPRFAKTFAAHDIQLPLATRIIQGLGLSIRLNWPVYAGAAGALAATVFFTLRTAKGWLWIENALIRLPYIRRIIVAVTAGRFARVLGIGLGSGLNIIEALSIGGRATGRPLFVAECESMADSLRRGAELGDAIKHSRYLPSFARRMISAGKDSTELAKACNVVARHFDRESAHLTKNINTIIEPLMTLGLAAIVLIVALSVFLPMWQMVKLNH